MVNRRPPSLPGGSVVVKLRRASCCLDRTIENTRSAHLIQIIMFIVRIFNIEFCKVDTTDLFKKRYVTVDKIIPIKLI